MIYPNPSNGEFKLDMVEDFTLEIYTIEGILVEESSNNNSFGQNLPAGIYVVKITTENNVSSQRVSSGNAPPLSRRQRRMQDRGKRRRFYKSSFKVSSFIFLEPFIRIILFLNICFFR